MHLLYFVGYVVNWINVSAFIIMVVVLVNITYDTSSEDIQVLSKQHENQVQFMELLGTDFRFISWGTLFLQCCRHQDIRHMIPYVYSKQNIAFPVTGSSCFCQSYPDRYVSTFLCEGWNRSSFRNTFCSEHWIMSKVENAGDPNWNSVFCDSAIAVPTYTIVRLSSNILVLNWSFWLLSYASVTH